MRNIKISIFYFVGLVFLIFVLGYYFYSNKIRQEKGNEYLAFDKYIVVRTPGGLLEVITMRKQETVVRKTSWICPFWLGLCDKLPKTTSQISAEAHYTYRVRLDKDWVLKKVSDEPLRYRLKVPNLEPKLPVAVSISTMREYNDKGIVSPAGPELEKMKAYLEKELASRAVTAPYIQAQSEGAAKTIEEFAREWMRDAGVKISKYAFIEIVFE